MKRQLDTQMLTAMFAAAQIFRDVTGAPLPDNATGFEIGVLFLKWLRGAKNLNNLTPLTTVTRFYTSDDMVDAMNGAIDVARRLDSDPALNEERELSMLKAMIAGKSVAQWEQEWKQQRERRLGQKMWHWLIRYNTANGNDTTQRFPVPGAGAGWGSRLGGRWCGWARAAGRAARNPLIGQGRVARQAGRFPKRMGGRGRNSSRSPQIYFAPKNFRKNFPSTRQANRFSPAPAKMLPYGA